MKHRLHLLLLAAVAFLAGCNSNPGWIGTDPTGKAETLAYEACKCLHEMVGKEPGWDLDKLMTEVKKIRKQAPGNNLQSAVLESEDPAILKALAAEEDFSLKMDDCECMKPIQDALLEQGVAFEDMMEQLDMKCLLGAFYN